MLFALFCFQHAFGLFSYASMFVHVLVAFSSCFMPCLDPSFLCVDVWVYMLTRLILCLWLCLAQIYMFVCMFYAPMPMSMLVTCLYAWVCVLPCLYVYIYMLRCISTCLHTHFHAYMCRLVCLHAQIDVLYMIYAIIYVLVCFTPLFCAQAQTLFVMPCAIVALLLLLSHFLVYWPNRQDLIQTLWSLSLSIHQGPHQRVWIILFACLCLLASMLYAYASLSFQALPCLMPSAGLILFGYIRHP